MLAPAGNGTVIPYRYSIDKSQLALFAVCPKFITQRDTFWLGKDDVEDFAKYRYLMQNFKNRIDLAASLLTNHVRAANTLYPTSLHEYEQRRDYQNFAIVNCEQIIKELQRVVEVFDVDINRYSTYIKAIDREIGLIKKWRQRDNKIKSYLQGNV